MGLKVWGMRPGGEERYICAADNQKQAASIFKTSLSHLRNYSSVTGNEAEIKEAMADPYTLLLSPVQ